MAATQFFGPGRNDPFPGGVEATGARSQSGAMPRASEDTDPNHLFLHIILFFTVKLNQMNFQHTCEQVSSDREAKSL